MNIIEIITMCRRGELEPYKLSDSEFRLAELLIGDTMLSGAESWLKSNIFCYKVDIDTLLILDRYGEYLSLCKSFCRDEGCFCDSGKYLYKQHWKGLLQLRYNAYEDLLDPFWQENIYKPVDFMEML